jgi:beta-galactosidase
MGTEHFVIPFVLAGFCFTPLTAANRSDSQIEFGVDYYAEDWPPERTEIDARLMQQAGFRTVRLVDTNWERLEPEEGRYDFAWLDRVIEILNRHGIRAILGTSSYVPPAWLIEKHPEFYAVNKDGIRYRWGGMGFVCLNNPKYRQYVEKLVTALASHYGRVPGVIGWQIDNELGTWGYACYDLDYCVPKFQDYLKRKFGTIEDLNRRWLTVSYGHQYSSWTQVPLNWSLGAQAHQAPLELEVQRFFSANVADFMKFQAEILRRYTSGQFITHNLSGPSRSGNAFEFAKPLDFLSFDNYPETGDYISPGFAIDLMRGFNHGNSFLILEHRSGYRGPFSLTDPSPPPGMVRLWAWQTLAHGADGVLFFRWRMSVGGSEQYWQGLLNYDGTPGRAFPEVSLMGEEIKKIGSIITHTSSPTQVGEIMSFDSLWAMHVGGSSFPYYDQLKAFQQGFRRWGLNVDFVEPGSDLRNYKIVVAPSLHVVDDEIAASLERFVRDGGVLILTARSGFKTPDNLAVQQPLPGLLSSFAMVRVVDYTLLADSPRPGFPGFSFETDAYHADSNNQVVSSSSDWPGTYTARGWADILEPRGAKVLFRYKRGYYSGRPAVTLAAYGKGKVLYVGTLLEPSFYLDMARQACGWARLDPGPRLPEGVDFSLRERDGTPLRFLLNFNSSVRTIAFPGTFQDILSGKVFNKQITMPALDPVILAPREASAKIHSQKPPGG